MRSPGAFLRLTHPLPAALLLFVIGGATIAGAWYSQIGLGFVPCKLCLWQRWPYYLGLPLAGLAALAAGTERPDLARIGLGGAAVLFAIGVGLGAYHAGVEWGIFLGPNDCGGSPAASGPAGVGDFLKSLERVRVVSCTEAPMRILGLSFAGWNALISLGLAALAAFAAARPHGSSSVSQ